MAPRKKRNPYGIDANDPFGLGNINPVKNRDNIFGINPRDPYGLNAFNSSKSGKNIFGINPDDPYGFGLQDQDTKKVRVAVSQKMQKQLFIRCRGLCEKCGCSLDGIIPHIHHKNGDPSDNRKANLIVLCPNCHSRFH